MAEKPKNPFQFWEKLKQRRVVRVMTVYVASSFAILQGLDMIFSRLGFPSWTVTLVMIVLACGLIVSIILSWIYDITPEGVKRTKDIEPDIIEDTERDEITAHGREQILISDAVNLLKEKKLFNERINKFKKKERIYNYSSILVILTVTVFFIFTSSSTVPFGKRDWIVITDFENLTDNPVFDKSLYTAFSLSISQSRHINVFFRSRMLDILAMMELNNQTLVDEKTGREIAVREGINLYIVPAISEVGNKYVITAKILEAKSGNLLKSETIYVESLDKILPGLDQLSKRIRRNLGESRYNIAMQDKPMVKATTSSLEALKLYSLGIDQHYKLDFEGARDYYEAALKIDTGFTAAKASLGNVNIRAFDPVKGREFLSQAVKSADNLTKRERLWVLALHAMQVENDILKGLGYFRMLTELYPDDPIARNNMGYYYQVSGEYEKAVKEYKEAIRIDPHAAIAYGGLLWVYLDYLGEADSALVWSEKMITDNPQNVWGYANLGSAWLCYDSLSKAEEAYAKAREINPDLILNLYNLAHTYRIQKKYEKAIPTLKYILRINQDEISAYYDLGVNYQSMGNQVEARKYFLIFKKSAEEGWIKKLPNDVGTYTSLAAVLARLGETDSSMQMLRKAIEIDSAQHYKFAEVLCLQGKIPEATKELENAFKKGYRDLLWIKLTPDLQLLNNDNHLRDLLGKYFK
jgi:tetratricopeptide (TPR) repeat protein